MDLLAGVIGPQRDDALDDETIARLQTLQEELDTIRAATQDAQPAQDATSSAADADGQRGAPPHRHTDSRIAQIEYEISRLRMRQMSTNHPAHTAPPGPKPTPATMLDTLPDDLTLIVYHQVGQELIAFVRTEARQIHIVRDLGQAPELQNLVARLAVQWQRFHGGNAFLAQHMVLLEQSAQRVLGLIYEQILAPILALPDLEPVSTRTPTVTRKLVIVPHGALHQVPFHALYDGTRYMVEQYAISYAPSVTVFDLCTQRAVRMTGNALVAGVADERMPVATEEVNTVSTQLRRWGMMVQSLSGAEATRRQLTALTAQSNVVHLACHGLFRGDNPMFSALRFHDGWFTAAEAAQLSLCNGLVTLSACESGRSQVQNSEESIGLSYAFLSAGAATLLVSQWLVQDESTAQLMQAWYEHLLDNTTGSLDFAEALRQAQLTVKARYPHPYYWAPFILVGQRLGSSD